MSTATPAKAGACFLRPKGSESADRTAETCNGETDTEPRCCAPRREGGRETSAHAQHSHHAQGSLPRSPRGCPTTAGAAPGPKAPRAFLLPIRVSAPALLQAGLSLGTVPEGQRSCRSQLLWKATAAGTPAPRPGLGYDGDSHLLSPLQAFPPGCQDHVGFSSSSLFAGSGDMVPSHPWPSSREAWGQGLWRGQLGAGSSTAPHLKGFWVGLSKDKDSPGGVRGGRGMGGSDSGRCQGRHGDPQGHARGGIFPLPEPWLRTRSPRGWGLGGGFPKRRLCGHRDLRRPWHLPGARHQPRSALHPHCSGRRRLRVLAGPTASGCPVEVGGSHGVQPGFGQTGPSAHPASGPKAPRIAQFLGRATTASMKAAAEHHVPQNVGKHNYPKPA